MKYSCLVIEDDIIERDLLEMYLSKINMLEIKFTCKDAAEALNVLSTTKVDIIFSDIDMPDISGIELLKGLKDPPVFIFITSHMEHAAESFNLDVMDFIVKPVSIDRLIKSINRAVELLNLKNRASLSGGEQKSGQEFFFIKDSKGYARLNHEDIIYIESVGDFSKLHTADDQTHTVLINLRNLGLQLPDYFVRVHKQYLVHFDKIVNVSVSEIVLKDGAKVPLSPSYRDNLLQLINARTLSRTARKADI